MNTILFDINTLNKKFKTWNPQQILTWSWNTFKHNLVMSSSFQTQSVPLLHMVANICPEINIIFIDTGYHYTETLTFRDELQKTFGLHVITARPELDKKAGNLKPRQPLYRNNPDLCCQINKVEPMQKTLRQIKAKAWITGIRHDQTTQRRNADVLESGRNGILKVNPLASWKETDVENYLNHFNLPAHPLFAQGYTSIGCVPCTRPTKPEENNRAGRWSDSEKEECGLHNTNSIFKSVALKRK